MKKELLVEEFKTTWGLADWVNLNNVEVVAICHGESSRQQDWVLFYYEIKS